MATIKDLNENSLVITPYGIAIAKIVDKDSGSIRVIHLTAKTPVTDFRISDIEICKNIKVKINTKSNYLDLNGKILSVKEYAPHVMLQKSRITCSVFHPELNKIVNIDFTQNEVEFISTREMGFY